MKTHHWKTVRIVIDVPVRGLSVKDTKFLVEQALGSSMRFDQAAADYRGHGEVGRPHVKDDRRVRAAAKVPA